MEGDEKVEFFWIRKVEGRLLDLLLSRYEVISGLAFLQSLLHLHQQLDAIYYQLNKLHLREAQPVSIRDISHTRHPLQQSLHHLTH